MPPKLTHAADYWFVGPDAEPTYRRRKNGVHIMYCPKIRYGLLAAIFLASISFIFAAESKDLGFIERMSVSELLNNHGYKGLTAVSGTKTGMDSDDGPGWYIVARCRKGSTDEDWIARLWVSDDWKMVNIIEVKRRGS